MKLKNGFQKANITPFLTGDNVKSWVANFDFVISHLCQIFEDKYSIVFKNTSNTYQNYDQRNYNEAEIESFYDNL